MADNDGFISVRSLNKRKNQITKERLASGAWEYVVRGSDGCELARITFANGREAEERLLNSDLLDIVRDRLAALNRSRGATMRSRNCAQHVTEALFWADLSALRAGEKDEEITEDTYNG